MTNEECYAIVHALDAADIDLKSGDYGFVAGCIEQDRRTFSLKQQNWCDDLEDRYGSKLSSSWSVQFAPGKSGGVANEG